MGHTKLNIALNINGTGAKGLVIIEENKNPVMIALLTENVKSTEAAARIVKTWNMHYELVEALTAALSCLRSDIDPLFRKGFEATLEKCKSESPTPNH